MQTQCCTEAHCSPLGYFTIQSAILSVPGGGGFRGSRDEPGVRLFVHCNVVKSLRFHYDYIVLSFRLSISLSLSLSRSCNLFLYSSTPSCSPYSCLISFLIRIFLDIAVSGQWFQWWKKRGLVLWEHCQNGKRQFTNIAILQKILFSHSSYLYAALLYSQNIFIPRDVRTRSYSTGYKIQELTTLFSIRV